MSRDAKEGSTPTSEHMSSWRVQNGSPIVRPRLVNQQKDMQNVVVDDVKATHLE